MTISTDTQAQQQAGRPPRRAGLGRLEGYGVALAFAAALGALALTSNSTYGPEDRPPNLRGSAFAVPIPALGGQTLAVYVADHEASRLPAPR